MDDTPAHPERRGTQQESTVEDRWSVWFFRLMQIGGLVVVFYEMAVEDVDRPWLLLVAVAMMLGGLGLQLLLRWLVGKVGPP